MLDARLGSAAKFVRQGAIFADIGTDHAHLPLFLLSEGRIERAVCSDINEGPLCSAEQNAAAAGLSEKIDFHLTDGALSLAGLGITDVAVCGMGGELIADIIDRAPWLRTRGVRLILQPMTRAGELRSYLGAAGFSVMAEDYSEAQGKYYVTVVAEYTGERRTLTETEAYLGREASVTDKNGAYFGYLSSLAVACRRRILGRRAGGRDTERDETILKELEKRLEGRTEYDG
ncbi:MAG: SAM-dependent methyltransferase [Clostridia bacterium]|nr:SAM-dependent methyltransferase [Clostridia bacterium]